ncbi:MAG: hypothetical protein ACFB20_03790 [Opitutales bacterium]
MKTTADTPNKAFSAWIRITKAKPKREAIANFANSACVQHHRAGRQHADSHLDQMAGL